jgi:ferredoxin--NADP+ reductase
MARKPLELNATLIRRFDLAEGLTIFRVRPEAHDFQTFEPGQYVVLGLNHPEHGPVQRSYSIASPPQTLPEYLDFYVRYVVRPASENPLTHLLFNLREGDRLFMGPKFRGKFTISSEVGVDDPRLRVLVAAGTGLAPFTSMVFDHLKRLGPTSQYLVLHGASYPHDMGYRAELEAALNSDPTKKRYFPTISRDPGGDAWPEDGFRGRVESFFGEEKLALLEKAAGLPVGFIRPANAVVFICGLTGTIANTLVRLLDRGFLPRELKLRNALHVPADAPASLFFEQYDTEPVLDVKNEAAMEPYRAQLRAAGVALEPPAAV